MESKNIKRTIHVSGMTCGGCELRITNRLAKLTGIENAAANAAKGIVTVEYNPNMIAYGKIEASIKKLGYEVSAEKKEPPQDKMSVKFFIGVIIILFAVYMIIDKTIGFNFIPEVNASMGYGFLFVIGLMTSLHCVAMCGGINLSQCVCTGESKYSKLKPSFLYNLGRVVAYTLLGGIVGGIGSVFSFSGTAKGIVAIVAGVFMILMGVNMLNIFPWMKRLIPKMPKRLGNKIYNSQGKHGPFYVGLLNGLMPCGPLQTMQIYALGTGSILAGAMSMLMFSLGTVPLMFGLGAISTMLSAKFTNKMLKVSAVLVLVLGVVMVSRGVNLSGTPIVQTPVATAPPKTAPTGNTAVVDGNTQYVTTNLKGGRYTPFTVYKGVPVKWTITVSQGDLNGCNNPLTIPKYGIEKRLAVGDNLIEFTPEETGNITYTCWMGMVRSNIKVIE